jgi:hypothetical protein
MSDTPDQELTIALDPFRLTIADFLGYVAATTDDEVLAWVVTHARPDGIDPDTFENILLDTDYFAFSEALSDALIQARAASTLDALGIPVDLRLDPDALTLRHMKSLRSVQIDGMIDWMAQHTSTDRDTLLALPLAVVNDLQARLLAEINRARSVPKAKRQRS